MQTNEITPKNPLTHDKFKFKLEYQDEVIKVRAQSLYELFAIILEKFSNVGRKHFHIEYAYNGDRIKVINNNDFQDALMPIVTNNTSLKFYIVPDPNGFHSLLLNSEPTPTNPTPQPDPEQNFQQKASQIVYQNNDEQLGESFEMDNEELVNEAPPSSFSQQQQTLILAQSSVFQSQTIHQTAEEEKDGQFGNQSQPFVIVSDDNNQYQMPPVPQNWDIPRQFAVEQQMNLDKVSVPAQIIVDSTSVQQAQQQNLTKQEDFYALFVQSQEREALQNEKLRQLEMQLNVRDQQKDQQLQSLEQELQKAKFEQQERDEQQQRMEQDINEKVQQKDLMLSSLQQELHQIAMALKERDEQKQRLEYDFNMQNQQREAQQNEMLRQLEKELNDRVQQKDLMLSSLQQEFHKVTSEIQEKDQEIERIKHEVEDRVQQKDSNLSLLQQQIAMAMRERAEQQQRMEYEVNQLKIQREQELDQLRLQVSSLQEVVERKDQEIMRLSQIGLNQSAVQKYTCYKCQGNKVDQHMRPCKPCGGSGYQSDRFNSELQHQIKDFIDQSVPQAFLKLRDCVNQSQNINEPVVDFDKNLQQRRQYEQMQRILNSMPLGIPKVQKKQVAMDASFVSESFSENFTVKTSAQVKKQWCLKNVGTQYIPKSTTLAKVDGEALQVICKSLAKDVPVNVCFDVEVQFEAPAQPGHYILQFQLKCEDKLFGDKVFCDFIVESADSESLRELEEMMNFRQEEAKPMPVQQFLQSQLLPAFQNNNFNPAPAQPITHPVGLMQPPIQSQYQPWIFPQQNQQSMVQPGLPVPNAAIPGVNDQFNSSWINPRPIDQLNSSLLDQSQWSSQPPLFPVDMGVSQQVQGQVPNHVSYPVLQNVPGQIQQPPQVSVSYDDALKNLKPDEQIFLNKMKQLQSFGYTNFQINLDLCKKHKGDINEIVNELSQLPLPVQEMPQQPLVQHRQSLQIEFSDIKLAERIEAIQDAAYKATMYQLLELGYKDFDKNMNALYKHKNDLEQAINEL